MSIIPSICSPRHNAGKSNHSSPVGLEALDVTSVTTATAFSGYSLSSQQQVDAYAQQWSTCKNTASGGSYPPFGLAPIITNLGTAPTVVAPGINHRRSHKGCAQLHRSHRSSPADYQRGSNCGCGFYEPHSRRRAGRRQVEIGRMQQSMQGVEIQVYRGRGFMFLAVNTITDLQRRHVCRRPIYALEIQNTYSK